MGDAAAGGAEGPELAHLVVLEVGVDERPQGRPLGDGRPRACRDGFVRFHGTGPSFVAAAGGGRPPTFALVGPTGKRNVRRATGRRGDRGRTPSMIWRSGRAGCCPRPGCWEQTPPPGRLCGSRSRRSRTGVAHRRAPGGTGRLACGRPAGGECQTSALHRLLTLGVRWHAPRHRHNGPRLRQASTPPPGTQVGRHDRLSPDQRGRARRPPTPIAATEATADGTSQPPSRPAARWAVVCEA